MGTRTTKSSDPQVDEEDVTVLDPGTDLPEGLGDDYLAAVQEIQSSGDPNSHPDIEYPEASDGEMLPGYNYDYMVTTPSGAVLPVLTVAEVEYYEDRRDRYLKDHRFSSVTDLQDLDRVLSTELILQRYDIWLTLNHDYFGQGVSEKDLLRYSKELTGTLINLKKALGLDKVTRDKDQGEDFASWFENVKRRADEFMVMRDEESEMARVLMHEVIALVQTHLNADEPEREEFDLSPEQVIEHIWENIRPRFLEVDESFRTRKPGTNGPDDDGGQKYWIHEL